MGKSQQEENVEGSQEKKEKGENETNKKYNKYSNNYDNVKDDVGKPYHPKSKKDRNRDKVALWELLASSEDEDKTMAN